MARQYIYIGILTALMWLSLAHRLTAQIALPPKLGQSLNVERWQRLRPLPPFDQDGGYDMLDLTLAHSAPPQQVISDSIGKPSLLQTLEPILMGRNIALGHGWTLGVDGLLYMVPEYNHIDGAYIGYEFMLERVHHHGRKTLWRSSNNITSRGRRYYTENHFIHYYAPERDGQFILSFGRTSRQTTYQTASEVFATRLHTPLAGESPLRHYSKTYLSLRHSYYLARRLYLTALALYEDRKPVIPTSTDSYAHRALVLELDTQLDLAPRLGISADFPTAHQRPEGYQSIAFGLRLRQALAPTERYSQYGLVELSASTARILAPEHRLELRAWSGTYFGVKRLSDADRFYLPRLEGIGVSAFTHRFATLPDLYSTDGAWAGVSASYHSTALLLSRHRYLGGRLRLDEGVHLRLISLSTHSLYWEAGYSVGWGSMARIGLFAGGAFTDPTPNVTLRLSLPVMNLIKGWGERY